MELPKYHEAFIPVLEILNSIESISSRALATKVRDNYYSDLPQELLSKKQVQEPMFYLTEFNGQNLI
jgi:restriction system protein